MRKFVNFLFCIAAISMLAGCATTPRDYTAFRAHHPRSILVLPPLNQSVDINATYGYYSTVTRPLAEMGYYVYPIALIDLFMKENGLPTAGEMHQVPLAKLKSIVGADAVLYVTVQQYGTKYQVLDSVTVVEANARLVDLNSGTTIWTGHTFLQQGANDSGQGGILGSLIAALVSQAITANADLAHDLSSNANKQLFCRKNRGLLLGPYHPEFLAQQQIAHDQ